MPATKLPSNHPDYTRSRRLALLFNLTLADYDTILAYQGGACAICGKPPKRDGNRLSVDHRHLDGLVRGLLCWNCNRGLGRLKDDLNRIEAMASYLRSPPATDALGGPRLGRTGRTTNKRKRTRKKT